MGRVSRKVSMVVLRVDDAIVAELSRATAAVRLLLRCNSSPVLRPLISGGPPVSSVSDAVVARRSKIYTRTIIQVSVQADAHLS